MCDASNGARRHHRPRRTPGPHRTVIGRESDGHRTDIGRVYRTGTAPSPRRSSVSPKPDRRTREMFSLMSRAEVTLGTAGQWRSREGICHCCVHCGCERPHCGLWLRAQTLNSDYEVGTQIVAGDASESSLSVHTPLRTRKHIVAGELGRFKLMLIGHRNDILPLHRALFCRDTG